MIWDNKNDDVNINIMKRKDDIVVLEDTPVYARGVGPDNHTVKEKRCGSRAEAGTVEELERERERERERQSVER